MRYLLSEYSIDKFQAIDDLVRMCYHNPLNNKWGYPWNPLGQIGSTMEGLGVRDVEYIEHYSANGDTLNGVCFHTGHDDPFKVWISPDLTPGSLLYELVIIHELCHGYVGSQKMHNKDWRAYYGRAVILYSQLINWDLSEPEWQIKHTVRRYGSEENPKMTYGDLVLASDMELESIVADVESNINHIRKDFRQLQEMRKGCQKSTSNTTPTPAYLASALRKAGTVSL